MRVFVYDKSYGPADVLSMIILILFFIALCACFSALIVYIEELQDFNINSMLENANLLDSMHEGLLILSKNTKKAMFCNYAALKIVNMFLRRD